MQNLVDFIPSGSFALYTGIQLVIGLPVDSEQCTDVQRGYLITSLVLCSIFCFFFTLYPTTTEGAGNLVDANFKQRISSPSLLIRGVLAILAFLALSLSTIPVMSCVFYAFDDVASRTTPILVAAICTGLEQIRAISMQ